MSFIYHPDEINKIWEIFEVFDAMPYIDEKTQRKISERIDDVFQEFGDTQWENGIQNCNHGEDYYS